MGTIVRKRTARTSEAMGSGFAFLTITSAGGAGFAGGSIVKKAKPDP
jgi:hypothetical protein